MIIKNKKTLMNMLRKMSIMPIVLVTLCLFVCNKVQAQADVNRIYFGNVDEYPLFDGKSVEEGFRKYISIMTNYPAKAAEKCAIGRVFVEFIVERDGSLSNLKVVGGADPILEAEALRVVKASPSWTRNTYTVNSSSNWTPGKIDGEAVRMSYTIPIKFSIGGNVKSSSKKAKPSKKTILLEEVDLLTFCVPCGEDQCKKIKRRGK
ncbi:MAG: energy transducer TonB [Prevotellaceae bacterium]|jgi:protein TonB|nr:energy transducer TonB [Prevotellaceae bacterium]